MKKWQALTTGVLFVAAANVLFINAGPVSPSGNRATGLKPMTADELTKLDKVKVQKVNPNNIGLERINKERRKQGLPDLQKSNRKEIETTEDGLSSATGSASGQEVSGTSVAEVDNSSMPAFPPVGDQGNEGSCVTWAIAYYQMSHEVCLATGCDNKNMPSQSYSPRFVYNMINGGVDNGSNSSHAYAVVSNHGAPRLSELPYVAGDYRRWELNPEHWRTAINSRVSQTAAYLVTTDAGMATVKQSLLNGHVLVFGTYVNSWVYSTVQTNPNSTANSFVGQSIMQYQNGTNGGHLMTIVGYDDNIWTDINGNGSVDAAELGAFKIANSWGAGYKNGGYVWASYDAFRTTSAVPGFSATRLKLTQGDHVYGITYSPYTPKLLAKVTVSHLSRQQMSIRLASSTLSSGTPQTYAPSGALMNHGGAYAFDGTMTEVEGTFYLDATNLSPTGSYTDKNFYLVSSDSSAGAPLTIRSFELVDPAVGNTLASAAGVPLAVDGTSKNVMVGSFAPDTQAPTAPGALSATVVSQKRGKRVTSAIRLDWTASTDNSGSISSYRVFRNGSSLGSTSSLTFTDANGATGVVYNYEVEAMDSSGNVSMRSSIMKGK